jgi:Cu2+-exporting ATPase
MPLEVGPVFSAGGRLLAALPCVEVTRADARAEAAALTHEGFTLYIASGDTSERVRTMAASLDIAPERAYGDLTPDGKRDLITSIDRDDTLMLGDGINDGPALSRALCSGTPAIDRPFVPARADFYFQTPGLAPVRLSLQLARSVRRVVKRALWFATLYNVFAVGLCYAGQMRPWLAAVLMPSSSLLVLAYTVHALSPRSSVWKS